MQWSCNGSGLPTSAYTSEAFVEVERRRIFSRFWHAVGFTHDVSEPGDVHPVMSSAGLALLLTRGHDGSLRVFHNYCRHRGMRLVDEPAKGRRNILCRYHAWCYGLDGCLLRVPHRDGFGRHAKSPPDIPGLAEVRSAEWTGIVFVDLGGKAGEFEDYLAPLAKRWANYDLTRLRHGASMTYDVEANWKLAIRTLSTSITSPTCTRA